MKNAVKVSVLFIIFLFLLAIGCGQLDNLSKKGEIYVVPETAVINAGETLQYSAIANSLIGQASSADITNLAAWNSSNTDVATVDQEGLATAIGNGVTDITADFVLLTNTGGVIESYSYSATATLTVNAPACSTAELLVNNWVKEASNPVINTGAPGTWDSVNVHIPTVIHVDGIYKMWYTGYDGTTWRIGLANSPDGINWTKYSGNPVMDLGSYGSWDDFALHSPFVMHDGATYKMWYIGFASINVRRIGYATSPDGINWTKYAGNPVLDMGSYGSWDDMYLTGPAVFKNGTGYNMLYGAYDGAINRIGLASSADGISWSKYAGNPVIDKGSSGEWDVNGVAEPTVIIEDGLYRVWFQGMNTSSTWQVGYATSLDGQNWTKYSGNPVLASGEAGSWDIQTADPFVIKDGSVYRIWYAGLDSLNAHRIGYAESQSTCP